MTLRDRNDATAIAVVGLDDWVRPALMRRLRSRGAHVLDKGSGSASLRGVGTVLVLPPVVPRGRHREHGTALGALRVTLSAAVIDNVHTAVVLSRIGAGDARSGYLEHLGTLEHLVASRIPQTAVIRVAHPLGPADNLGPFALGVQRAARRGDDGWGQVEAEPVDLDAVVATLAAVCLDPTEPGLLELGGEKRMCVSDIADAVAGGPQPSRVGLRRAIRDGAASSEFRAMLAVPSLPARSRAKPGRVTTTRRRSSASIATTG